MTYRTNDRHVWEGIFRTMPPEWFTAGPSDAMVRCLTFFRGLRSRRLLDVGAGFGRWAVYLAGNGVAPVVALDYVQHACRLTATWAMREGWAVSAVAGDAVALPFIHGSFDGLLAALVLENLNAGDRGLAIGELCRVSAPGAHAFFLFNPPPTAEQVERSSCDNPTRNCHIEPCTDEELVTLLANWSAVERGTTSEGFRFVAAVKSSDAGPRVRTSG